MESQEDAFYKVARISGVFHYHIIELSHYHIIPLFLFHVKSKS
jgi:hypothetical protein